MNAHSLLRTTALIVGLAVPATAAASEWKIDPAHSRIGFSVRHLMVSNVEGRFAEFDGVVVLDEKDIRKSSVNVDIDLSSVDTDHEKRDNHLRSDDFFNVEKYPKMTFKSDKVVKKGKKLKVHGKLTLHGVTKPVVLHVKELTEAVKNPFNGAKTRGAVATATIDRTDFGLTWNKALETGGVLVGTDVKIVLKLELAEA